MLPKFVTMLNSRTLNCCALALTILSIVSVAAAQGRSAYVLDFRGQWRIERGSNNLARAATVQEGSRIQHLANSQPNYQNSQDYIVLGGLWETPKTVSCSPSKNRPYETISSCSAPQSSSYEIISAAREHRGSQIYSEVMEIWRGQKSWDEGASRGIELRDAVIPVHTGELSLSTMFSDLPQDSFHLRIRRIESGMGRAKFTDINNSIVFIWDPSHPRPLAIDGLAPGLYEIGLMSPNLIGQYEYSGISGWALACDTKLSWCEQSFAQAAALTNDWGDSVRPVVKRDFLRAYLQRLSLEAK
jgi:hypothetical protein